MFFVKITKLHGMNKGFFFFFSRVYSCSVKPSKSFLYLGKKSLFTFCFNSHFITVSLASLHFKTSNQLFC